MTITELTRAAAQTLQAAGVDTAGLDAELLVAHAIERDRSWILANPHYDLSDREQKKFEDLRAKRAARVPVAYLTGHKEFFGLDFLVNKKTLVPRPETEILVESVLAYISDNPRVRSLMDIGTGSGAIACAIAKAAPHLSHILAIDVSTAALEVAGHNAERLGLADRIQFKRTHVGRMQTLKSTFDIIVSNPPYLSQQEYFQAKHQCPELTYEPQLALLGGTDGLLFLTQVIRAAKKHLNRNGALFIEIGATQGPAVKKLAHIHLPEYNVFIKKDLAGLDRIAEITNHSLDDGVSEMIVS